MNNARRKLINQIVERLNNFEASDSDTDKEFLEGIQSDIENIKDEEQDAFDNMPEGLQQSERGQASEQAVENLDEACGNIQTLIDNTDIEEDVEYELDTSELESAVTYLQEATA